MDKKTLLFFLQNLDKILTVNHHGMDDILAMR